MLAPYNLATEILLVSLAIAISYMDVNYRRIPNKLVLVTLIGGLSINTFFSGWAGLLTSLSGFVAAFVMMLVLHLIGTMGAGDV
ncbi:MAG TPA: A24 family peptidase, partial [Pyrinomonadaceae bacterium]|nr:A24 family peptidase [Pyrinomonadaceae bacterium]